MLKKRPSKYFMIVSYFQNLNWIKWWKICKNRQKNHLYLAETKKEDDTCIEKWLWHQIWWNALTSVNCKGFNVRWKNKKWHKKAKEATGIEGTHHSTIFKLWFLLMTSEMFGSSNKMLSGMQQYCLFFLFWLTTSSKETTETTSHPTLSKIFH